MATDVETGPKLTKAQAALLVKIAEAGGQFAKAALTRGEITASSVLNFLDLIALYEFANGRFWLITDKGRAALTPTQGATDA